MLTFRTILALGLTVVVAAIACGSSESEVEQMVAEAVKVQAAQLEKDMHEWMDAETRRVNEWVDKEDMAMNEWKERQRLRIEEGVDGNIAFLRELRTEVSEAFIRLEQALCLSDYQANSTRSALWWTLDHLTGGASTLEDAKATWLAMAIGDDYGEISTICDGRDDGTLLIKPTWD